MIDIRKIIDLKVLQNIQDQFSDVTGLAAVIADMDGNYITEASNFTDFCMKHIKGCQEGLRRCLKYETECRGIYTCHAGLMGFSADIIINGEKAGIIAGGQVLSSAPDPDRFHMIARELGIDENTCFEALMKVPVRSERIIRAAAQMFCNMVNHLAELEYLKKLSSKNLDVFAAASRNIEHELALIKKNTSQLQRFNSMAAILSKNASIEAERAGMAGAGFAIIAKEIDGLSKSSSNANEQIKASIDKMEKSVANLNEKGLWDI